MKSIAPHLWVAEAPLRFAGLEVGARMTIIRLPEDRLLLHSPIAASEALVRDVEALGQVAYVVAPNRFHHLYVSEWQKAFPDAEIFVAPGLEKKRPDFGETRVLTSEPPPEWAGDLEQVAMRGFSLLNEIVFFHAPSATLLATDLAFNIGPHSAPMTRFAFRMMGAYGKLTPTFLEWLFVRDRAAFCAGLEQILDWPFESVIVAHGDVSESGGRQQLIDNYGWILEHSQKSA